MLHSRLDHWRVKNGTTERTNVALMSRPVCISKMECCACAVCRVENAIGKVAADADAAASQPGKKQKGVSKVKQKARACLQEMVANVSPAFIR